MTDEFNLVPGTNEEKLLDNILRTAQGEQPQYNLAPNWRIEQYLDAIQKALSGGGGLPPVTASDAGKVLAVDNSGVWGAQEPIGKKFIVTLTPTSQDFSGTMDKTVAEIDAAYKAGREIWFKVMTGATTYTMCPIAQVGKNVDDYPSYNAYIVDAVNHALIYAFTGTTNDGTKNTYSTMVFPLTPAT